MAKRKGEVEKPSRQIHGTVQNELWGKAAGRCQFPGCNKLLYRSAITQEPVILAEKAHIYPFADNGPRGQGGVDVADINNVDNLMLLCRGCHKTIDYKNGQRYSVEILKKWKHEHETRIETVSEIKPENKTCVVTYTANIDGNNLQLDFNELVDAIFPNKFPISSKPINLSMQSSLRDDTQPFWNAESANLKKLFERSIHGEISEGTSDFTLFAIAPQPLLVLLGTLFTDKVNVEVRQLMREPKTWKWQEHTAQFKLNTYKSDQCKRKIPALCLSISAKIDTQRITSLFDSEIDIWTVTLDEGECGNDIIRCPEQLSHFREITRKAIKMIMERYGTNTPLHIFPAMPVSCAVELGRIRMPKADMPWIIYDQSNVHNSFIPTLTIGDSE